MTVEPPETAGMDRKRKRVSAQEEAVTVETSETLEIESLFFCGSSVHPVSGVTAGTTLKINFQVIFKKSRPVKMSF